MTDNVVLPITGEELQTLIATIKNGGIQGTGVNGYRFAMNSTTGKLELYKEDTLIAVQDDDGSWFKTAVSTGVGSLHLGGGVSSTPSHSVSAAGQNVVFKSEAFNSDPNKAIVWFPAGWQGITADLTGLNPPTFLSFGSIDNAFAPNGAVQSAGVAFDFDTTIAANICVASITCVAHEAYSGVIKNIIRATATGSETHESSATINVTAGQSFTVTYPACYFARQNDSLNLQMIKSDGQPLMVRGGTTNAAQPWRALRVRPFTDVSIAPLDGWAANRMMRTNASGVMTASTILQPSRAIVSDANGILTQSEVTSTEVSVIDGSTARDNSVIIADTDGFVFNDNGQMMQLAASRVLDYMQRKFKGNIAQNGDIKEAYRTDDHDGWILMNGRFVSSLTTTQQQVCTLLGISSQIPTSMDRYVVGAGLSHSVGALVGSVKIARSALPNVTLGFNVNSGNASQGHTHSIDPPATTTSGGTAHSHGAGNLNTVPGTGNHEHKYDRMGVRGASGSDFNVGNGSNSETQTTGTGAHTHTIQGSTSDESTHTHSVNIAAFTSAGESQSHTHNVTGNTDSMNGNVQQTDYLPSSIAFGRFIYLGL